MIKSLYVEMDDLFDTRLSFLNVLTEDKEIPKINYHNRIRDSFETIPQSVFNHYYSYRNKLVLRNALPTSIFDLIIEFIKEYIKTNESSLNFKLYLNTYPYELNSIEIENLESSLNKTFLETDITIMSVDPYDLKLDWFASCIDVIIMYNGIKWLEYKNIIGEIRKYPIMDKTMIVPYKPDGIGDASKINKNEIELLSIIYKSIIDLKVVDLKTFNARVAN